jgi:polyisoprenoid-binding protein YceI
MVPARARLLGVLVAGALLVVSCGGAAAPPATPTPTSTASPTATAQSGSWTVTDKSKANVRVREQLVGVSAPSDAVLVATGAKGAFAIKDDGTFTPDSKISFDVGTLTSDQPSRDQSVKRNPLEVSRFPTADFAPTKATGLRLPMPESGDFTFTLAGKMTIHGVSKEVTFDVTAKRSGNDLTATATANPTWKFADFGMEPPSSPLRVVSVTDEIKLIVDLVAARA